MCEKLKELGYDELIEKLGGVGASEKVASLIHKRTHE